MKRFLTLPFDVTLETFEEDRNATEFTELRLHFQSFDPEKLCLELALLEYTRSKKLTLASSTTNSTVRLLLQTSDESGGREGHQAEYEKVSDGFQIKLSYSGLRYLLGFLLDYYRDGAVDVSHIHLEDDTGLHDVTFELSDVTDPIPGKEASKILRSKE